MGLSLFEGTLFGWVGRDTKRKTTVLGPRKMTHAYNKQRFHLAPCLGRGSREMRPQGDRSSVDLMSSSRSPVARSDGLCVAQAFPCLDSKS